MIPGADSKSFGHRANSQKNPQACTCRMMKSGSIGMVRNGSRSGSTICRIVAAGLTAVGTDENVAPRRDESGTAAVAVREE